MSVYDLPLPYILYKTGFTQRQTCLHSKWQNSLFFVLKEEEKKYDYNAPASF